MENTSTILRSGTGATRSETASFADKRRPLPVMQRAIRNRMALDLADHLSWKALYFSSRYPRSRYFAAVARKHTNRAERLRRFAHA